MQLNEIKAVGLDIMKDIHCFCCNNGIRYSLAYGSLLGAIRHNGFIPWDDDIDIMMPRNDFEVFSKSYSSHGHFVLSSVYDKDTFINYTRVYDSRTMVIGPANASIHPVGIWVDVFPIDGIPDELNSQIEQFDRLRKYTGLVLDWRRYLSRIRYGNILRKIWTVKDILLLKYHHPYESVSDWHDKIVGICKEYQFGTTKYCSSLVCVEANKSGRQEVFETTDFNTYSLHIFEDVCFYIIDSYDRVLRTIYGNYMKLPPEDQRVSHVIHNWKFYWR